MKISSLTLNPLPISIIDIISAIKVPLPLSLILIANVASFPISTYSYTPAVVNPLLVVASIVK